MILTSAVIVTMISPAILRGKEWEKELGGDKEEEAAEEMKEEEIAEKKQ